MSLRPIDIARKLKVSTSTLRGYETRGIVPSPKKSKTGYRLYTEEHLAYFECVVAMSHGFGMDVTAEVLTRIQSRELNDALWIINEVQVKNSEDKQLIDKLLRKLSELSYTQPVNAKLMTVGEVAQIVGVATSTLRYWESEGYIQSVRGDNAYRYFDPFECLKAELLKSLQHALYSEEVVQLKRVISLLAKDDYNEATTIANQILKQFHNRNRAQLQGLAYLERLCEKVNL